MCTNLLKNILKNGHVQKRILGNYLTLLLHFSSELYFCLSIILHNTHNLASMTKFFLSLTTLTQAVGATGKV